MARLIILSELVFLPATTGTGVFRPVWAMALSNWLRDARFHEFQLEVDRERCGGPLQVSTFPRKLRGVLARLR